MWWRRGRSGDLDRLLMRWRLARIRIVHGRQCIALEWEGVHEELRYPVSALLLKGASKVTYTCSTRRHDPPFPSLNVAGQGVSSRARSVAAWIFRVAWVLYISFGLYTFHGLDSLEPCLASCFACFAASFCLSRSSRMRTLSIRLCGWNL